MVAVASGRRPGSSRRRPGGLRQQQHQHQHQHQRLLAVAVAAHIVTVTSTEASVGAARFGGGAGGCCLDFVECLLCVLRALGMGSCLPAEAVGRGGAPLFTLKRSRMQRSGSRRAAEQQQVKGIPGRIAANGSCAVASLYTLQGKKGVNQDAMVVLENFGSRDDTVFCGVFDGHGPYGHMVAKRVRDLLPMKVVACLGRDDSRESSTSNPRSIKIEETSSEHVDEETTVSFGVDENGVHPEIFTTLKASFLRAFHAVDSDLKRHKHIDCYFSGTTAVTVVKQGQDLIIGNLGDSRAVLGTREENDSLIAVQLTVDLKPDLPNEAKRIRQRRGRIFSLPEEPEVARVWLPRYNSPGLAMARAFGDFCLKDYGLISVPDVFYHRITEKDLFIVLATDGVWDVLSNSEVVNIVASASSRASAARFLVECAHQKWRTRFPTSKIDDCAVVCLFLDMDATTEPSSSKNNDVTEAGGSKYAPSSSSANEQSVTVRSSIGIHANVVTALSTDEEWSVLDSVSPPVMLPNLPKSVSGPKLSLSVKK